MLRDLRHAIRLLVQNKGWTLVVLLSLALGIGANATVFSAINGLLLRTLPVADPHVIGTVLQINTVPVTVIGVTPPAFTGVQQVLTEARDITLPVALDPRFNFDSPTDRTRLSQPAWWWLQIMGRLKPGTTPDKCRANSTGCSSPARARRGRRTWDRCRSLAGRLPRTRTARRSLD